MLDWLETPTSTAALGVLLAGCAFLLVAGVATVLGVASVYMKPARAARVLMVMRELRLLMTAMRGKPPPTP